MKELLTKRKVDQSAPADDAAGQAEEGFVRWFRRSTGRSGPRRRGPPGRCRNEAAFAALSGTNPVPASSGKTIRHRLNRGGDRALNRAIHAIALTRIRNCARTCAYIKRRTAEGKTAREIRRCLKRYIARELYRALNAAMTT